MTEAAETEPTGPPALVVELWYAEPPDLSDPRLLAALRAVAPAAQPQQDSISVPHEALTIARDGHPVPLLTVVMAASPLGAAGKTLPDTTQTWDWAEADEAVARCRGSLLVTEMFAAGFAPQQRVTALGEVVAALVRHTHPSVLSWPQSQRVSDPAGFEVGSAADVINVRFFSVGDAGDEMIMDTLGLHVFELPDVQCHYRNVDPGQVAALLFGTASYLFDAGDVIDDGHTISGPDGEGRYVCRHELSLLAPRREVVDVDLGEPYAAGSRNRATPS